MPRVRILPETLSNKIAAGEVVERPGSVVKELVENALDAGATRISVEAENGGRTMIRVADDGHGMERDDALLAIERHATSKIAETDDLFAIRTLGFRGEALPSIASVSRFTLLSRTREAEAGTEIALEGGRLLNVADAGAPPGTLVTVRDLFFNTPARRKFLKTVATETGHIGDNLARIALGRPGVDFRWAHNGRLVKHWPAVADALDRVADVLGQGLRPDLHPIALDSDGVRVSGWAASPRVARPTSRGIHLFVNGRFVRDRLLHSAVLHGYRERLMKGQFPVLVCMVEIPPDRVDVNVHPTKHEVRFADPRRVRAVVAAAVRGAVEAAERPGWGTAKDPSLPASTVREAPPRFATSSAGSSGQKAFSFRPSSPAPGRPASGWGRQDRLSAPEAPAPDSRPEPPGRTGVPVRAFADLRVVGQFQQTYLLCESPDSLVLIDQHAAHERVFYEQLQSRSAAANAASQRLLVPETVEVDHGDAERIERFAPDLDRLGLAVEPFGGTTLIVTAVPALLAGAPVEPLLRDILAKLADPGEGDAAGALDDCLKIMACHGAIRARQRLDDREIRRLLVQLDECGIPGHCPHGRPTWIEWSARSLQKAFGRIP